MADEKGQIRSGPSKGRMEALTDGVFAFALTLLVLNIEVPSELPRPLPVDPVRSIMLSLVPDFAHYLMAFIALASFWVTHHIFFDRVRVLDGRLVWLNIFALLFIALLPFSTQLADTYVDFPVAAMVFEANVLIVGLLFYAQWSHATSSMLADRSESPEAYDYARRRMLVMPLLSALALAIAFAGISWSLMIYVLVPFAYFAMGRMRK